VRLMSLLLFAVMGIGVSSQPFSCFPRMVDQPSVKPFEKRMPEAPPGQVPFSGPGSVALTKQEAAALRNPIAPSAKSIARGKLYYGYYCQMCHGNDGRRPGPVGESYVPAPADLTSARVAGMSDGALAYAMVTGMGHDPVLESTVPLDRRWHIVNWLRGLRPRQRGPEPLRAGPASPPLPTLGSRRSQPPSR
jgi:mono/diheme cytochrome c family protein